MILIIGATGLLGGQITRQVLRDRQDVRILVRPNSPYQPLVEAGAQLVLGDLKDQLSLTPALAGIDTVISTATAGQRGGEDTIDSVDLAGNQNLIDAAAQAGVRQFIFVSTISSDPNSPAPMMRAKGLAEARLRESGMGFTILALNGIMDVMLPLIVGGLARAGQPVTLVGEGRRRHSWVAAADAAAFAVAATGHPAAMNQRLVIGGPEAVSWRDVVATYERVLGYPIPVRTIAPGELLPNLPPVPGLAEALSGVMAFLETFDSPIEMAETARTFGVRLTPLEEFVRQEMASAPSPRPDRLAHA
jgi:NADH dehydrogenase